MTTLVVLALQAGPSLSLTPATAPPGASVEATGAGFPPKTPVTLYWDGDRLPGRARVDSDGAFAYVFEVPKDATPGTHRVRAESRDGVSATATVTVPQPAAPAPDPAAPAPDPAAPASEPTVAESSGGDATATNIDDVLSDVTESASTEFALPTSVGRGVRPGDSAVPSGETPADASIARAQGRADTDEPDLDVKGGLTAALLLVVLIILGMAAVKAWDSRPTRDERRKRDRRSRVEEEPPPIPLPPIDAVDGGWKRLGVHLPGGGEIDALADFASGYFAFGRREVAESHDIGVIWRSTDAAEWTEVSNLGATRINASVAWRGQVVALGIVPVGGRYAATTWSSTDGTSWTQSADPEDPMFAGVRFDGAASGDGIIVAYGRGPKGPGSWTSENGSEWQAGNLMHRLDVVAAIPGGFAAFGRHSDGGGPLVARSEDGRTWVEATSTEIMLGFEGVVISAVAAFGGGLVAAGTHRLRNTASVWVSDEGEAWSEVPLLAAPDTSIDHLIQLDDRLVAIGSETPTHRLDRSARIVAWESRDGALWIPTEASDAVAYGVPNSAVAAANSIVVYGHLEPGGSSPWPDRTPARWVLSPSPLTAPIEALAGVG